jgi:hypothetical protein
VGLVHAGNRFDWHLRNSNTSGPADRNFRYGVNDGTLLPGNGEGPVVGDWNGNGVDTPGVITTTRTGRLRWLLRNRAAIASGPASAGWPGVTHCTAWSQSALVSPSSERLVRCHGVIGTSVGTHRWANWAQRVQNAQSPS